MKPLKFIFLSLMLVLDYSCSNETVSEPVSTDLDPKKYYERLDIPYGNDSKQTFDLYLPANRDRNTKLLVLVHGGGWSAGDKKEMNSIKDLIRIHFPRTAIANINYRLADENNMPYPMQIEDITAIVNSLKENQDKYVISDTIGFIGISAGAHLSLLWSYAFDTKKQVTMVCSIVGPTNFTDPAYLNHTNPELQALIALFGINPTTPFLQEVSPYHQVTPQAPPTILFYGGKDPLIPTTQGTAMRDKLQNLNVTHAFTLYPDAGHGWVGTELLDTWSKLKVFINTHL